MNVICVSHDNLKIHITSEIPPTKTAWFVENLGQNCFYSYTERKRDREEERQTHFVRKTKNPTDGQTETRSE